MQLMELNGIYTESGWFFWVFFCDGFTNTLKRLCFQIIDDYYAHNCSFTKTIIVIADCS